MSLSTSFALSQAANDAMSDEVVKATAFMFQDTYDQMDRDTFLEALFQFSGNLVAITASLVTEVFMTQEQIEEMVSEAIALQDLSKSVDSE